MTTVIPTRRGPIDWTLRRLHAAYLRMQVRQAEFDACHWDADALVAPAKAQLARQRAAELRVQLALVE